MAAGDVVVTADSLLASGIRLVGGTVTLDGSNPTPVDLSGYLASVDAGVVNIEGSSALGDDPNMVTSAVSGATLNVYAWKNISGTDPTQVASTDNARLVNWIAMGPPLITEPSL